MQKILPTPTPEQIDAARKHARTLIERGWLMRESAVNAEGEPCASIAPDACAWCLSAAVFAGGHAVAGGDAALTAAIYAHLERKLAEELGAPWSLSEWNDQRGRTPQHVAALLDGRAAELEAYCAECDRAADVPGGTRFCPDCGSMVLHRMAGNELELYRWTRHRRAQA